MRPSRRGDASLPKNEIFAIVGTVDELVDQPKCAGRKLLLNEAACGRQRDQVGDPARLVATSILARVIDVGRRPPRLALSWRGRNTIGRPRWCRWRQGADGSPHGIAIALSRKF